jgi:hypothetical protein
MNIFEKISLLWQLNKGVSQLKSGFLTSEFWLGIAGLITTIGLAFWGSLKPEWVASIVVIIPVIYTISRTIVKATASKDDDAIFNKILEKLKPIFDKLNIPVEPLQ